MTATAFETAPARVRPTGSWQWAGVGVMSGAAGLGIGSLAAGLLGSGDPVLSVGAAAIDAAPTPLKEFAVSTFGTADKAVLLIGIAVVLTLLCAAAGLVARRHGTTAMGLVALLGVIAAIAAATRPSAGTLDVVPSLVAAITSMAAISVLRTAALAREGSAITTTTTVTTATTAGSGSTAVRADRRRLLLTSVGIGAGAAVAGAVGGVLTTSRRATESAREAVRLPVPRQPLPALPATVDVGVSGATPFTTPPEDFYRIDTALVVPRVDVDTWTLRIGGRVRNPVEISYADLTAMPMVEADVTLACVSNEVGGGYVGNSRWLGVPLADLLDRVGIDPGADQLFSTSADGWTCSTPMAAVRDGRNALVAVGMGGQPLPLQHGFPARLVVPGLYGYVSATKWLTSMEATTFAERSAYWTDRGWAERAPILTQARIDVPKASARVPAGRVAVAGVAWAQHRGVAAVEVQIDDGPWTRARMGSVPSIDTWRTWVLPWDAATGQHTIRVRAIDDTGQPQTAQRSDPFPRGATGRHEVVVTVT